ncbi:MAG: LysM peptidoglycan-binding domain-containing protein, partial [Nitrospirota bacterium]
NHIANSHRIKAGQYLNIPEREKISNSFSKSITYRVKRGDTLWDLSRDFDVSIYRIKRWNNIRGNTIYPGDKIILFLSADRL